MSSWYLRDRPDRPCCRGSFRVLDAVRAAVLTVLAALVIFPCAGLAAAPAAPIDPDGHRRCLALIAYAEAANQGPAGMAAVIRVVRNRTADGRFPRDACAVAIQAGQFQPVEERPALRRALLAPGEADLVAALGGADAVDPVALRGALALARVEAGGADPTAGALYFVNPDFMDPDKCPWFATLKRTVRIGAHVFMTHYGPGERRQGPALDCSLAGRGRAVRADPLPSLKPPSGSRVRVIFGQPLIGGAGRGDTGRPVVWNVETRLDHRRDPIIDRRVGSPRKAR